MAEEAKSFLSTDVSGSNLYDHLTDVLTKILSDRPDDALAAFESISKEVKMSKFTVDSAPGVVSNDAAAAAAAANLGKLAPIEGADPAAAQSLYTEAWLLEYAGVSFGSDTMTLQAAMAELTAAGNSGIRLWGKLNGTTSDYFIFEGTAAEPAESAEGTEDASGSGANAFAYWALSTSTGAVTQLGNVSYAQVVAARKVRKFLTGDLSAKVSAYPPFPGAEAGYLRAIIALISSDCTLAVNGTMVLNEDGTASAAGEDEYSWGDSFCHAYVGLNNLGRTVGYLAASYLSFALFCYDLLGSLCWMLMPKSAGLGLIASNSESRAGPGRA